MDATEARRLLEAERQRLQGIRDGHLAEQFDEAAQASVGELSSADQHPGDLGTETFERERDASVLEHVEAQLEEVDAALQRVEQGTYGICEATGERIPDERLRALPTARYTVEAQERVERAQGAGSAG